MSVRKSVSDNRDYKFVTLKNGIQVTLIRIPEGQSSKSAVAVSVGAGSMHEPDEYGGLAHFVEHCVFLGNKKYPNRNSLDKLISKHNGYSNAHTELEYTAFYLEVNKEAISRAVDIFAAAFESPLFHCEMCCAELEAVDSEFHEILNNDDCRIEQLLCHLSDPGHAYKKFTWGNKASLLTPHGGESLVNAAQTFYTQMYTPNRMHVSIVSSHSFEKMEKWLESFERLATRSSTNISRLESCEFPISPHRLPLSLNISPICDVHQLVLIFQMPPIRALYKTKPVDYIAHILGHEGEGSLIAVLRELNLATEISAGIGSDGYSCNSSLSMFELKLTLTQKGLAEWKTVLHTYLYPYIEQCKLEGVCEKVYAECAILANFQFENTSEDSTKEPIDTAEEFVVAMQQGIEPRDVLISEYLFDKFDAEKIKFFFSYIDSKKAITILVSNGLERIQILEEPIFGIKYAPVDTEWGIDDVFTNQKCEFIIPPLPNPFVPKRATPATMCIHEKKALYVTPEIVQIGPNCTQYIFTKCRSVPSVKLDVRIQLDCRGIVGVEAFVRTQLFVGNVTDYLENTLYSAKLVGYSVSIAATAPRNKNKCVGIEVCVNGYFEGVPTVVELVLAALKDLTIHTSSRTGRVKEQIKRGFTNEETHPVTSQALNARRVAIAPLSFFRSAEKLAALNALNECLNACVWTCVDAIFVGANATAAAQQLGPQLNAMTRNNEAPVDEGKYMVKQITSPMTICESTWNQTSESTGCLIVYYQLSDVFDVKIAAVADVISDLMSEPFFDSLRTEEQLGYSVQCGSRSTNGSVGIEFMIQSSRRPSEMVDRIDRFIANFFAKEIAPNSEFREQIEALVDGLIEPPNSLGTETKDLWNEVSDGRFLWNFNELVKDEIQNKFTKNSVKILIEEFLMTKNRIVIQINPPAHADDNTHTTHI